ncbi:Peptidyl-tRNA hydrolase [Planctomycetes bacterium Pan216]|uniref:Peptidyl-tRNA hydrolase n=1 Tax=Kolteria novifilia TaxID=2527975 RepID=A0A518B9U3_9BACT|nr:Peptidyl-tRNA hydrolase [Planctomycetes bacterium Pan216]
MKLVVGLGNPGEKYRRHRHNIGFMILDQVASSNGASSWQRQFDGQVCDCRLDGDKMVLLKPQTFMNRSGRSVKQAMSFYKLSPEDVLVVCDDVDLPIGRVRIRAKGGSGGHNGLKDIFSHMGTQEFARFRVGVGSARETQETADYVLSGFSASQQKVVDEVLIDAGRAVEWWCRRGVLDAMNEFNGTVWG